VNRAEVPGLLRRRIGTVGQAALRSAWEIPTTSAPRLVFASRHGEFGRTLSILDSLITEDGVSPADFTLSVHHALAGLLSIAQSNRRGHTTVSAGPDTFGFGLLEAAASALEQPDQPVLFVYYDEPLPSPYQIFDSCDEAMVVVLGLSAKVGEMLTMDMLPGSGQVRMASAAEFLRFWLTGAHEAVSQGERVNWRWTRHVAAN
jgi:hypothetical protein